MIVSETFGPGAECALFWLEFGRKAEFGKKTMWRDFSVIGVANLASFLIGEVFNRNNWFGLMD